MGAFWESPKALQMFFHAVAHPEALVYPIKIQVHSVGEGFICRQIWIKIVAN